jgi:hypothetical protein
MMGCSNCDLRNLQERTGEEEEVRPYDAHLPRSGSQRGAFKQVLRESEKKDSQNLDSVYNQVLVYFPKFIYKFHYIKKDSPSYQNTSTYMEY